MVSDGDSDDNNTDRGGDGDTNGGRGNNSGDVLLSDVNGGDGSADGSGSCEGVDDSEAAEIAGSVDDDFMW